MKAGHEGDEMYTLICSERGITWKEVEEFR